MDAPVWTFRRSSFGVTVTAHLTRTDSEPWISNEGLNSGTLGGRSLPGERFAHPARKAKRSETARSDLSMHMIARLM